MPSPSSVTTMVLMASKGVKSKCTSTWLAPTSRAFHIASARALVGRCLASRRAGARSSQRDLSPCDESYHLSAIESPKTRLRLHIARSGRPQADPVATLPALREKTCAHAGGWRLYRRRVLLHVLDQLANPAITIGRLFSNTFAGIAPSSARVFIAAQLVGAALAVAAIKALYPGDYEAAGRVRVTSAGSQPASPAQPSRRSRPWPRSAWTSPAQFPKRLTTDQVQGRRRRHHHGLRRRLPHLPRQALPRLGPARPRRP